MVNGHLVAPGTVSLGTIVSAAGALDTSALTAQNTAILSHVLSTSGGALSLSTTADFAPAGLPSGGLRLGALIGEAQRNGLTHFQALTAALIELPTVAQLHQAYWDLSGAGATYVSSLGARTSHAFTQLLLGRHGAEAARPTTDAAGRGEPGSGAWAQGYGDSQRTSADPLSAGADLAVRTSGLAVGADRRVGPDTVVGLAVGSDTARFTLSNDMNGRSEGYQAGAYVLHHWDAAYAAAAVSFARQQLHTARTLPFVHDGYSADLRSYGLSTRAEAGWRLAVAGYELTPYAALQLQRFVTPAYQERPDVPGSTHLALAYERRTLDSSRTELGGALARQFELAGGQLLRLRTALAWVHERSSALGVDAALQTLPDSRFSMTATPRPADVAQLALWAELRPVKALALGLSLSGEAGSRTRAGTAAASVRYQW
jgi:outer membrane autotransporter protein